MEAVVGVFEAAHNRASKSGLDGAHTAAGSGPLPSEIDAVAQLGSKGATIFVDSAAGNAIGSGLPEDVAMGAIGAADFLHHAERAIDLLSLIAEGIGGAIEPADSVVAQAEGIGAGERRTVGIEIVAGVFVVDDALYGAGAAEGGSKGVKP